jgi:putative MATE family efflux protein
MTKAALKARLTEGSVASQLTRMAVPMIGGILAMMAFNLTDTYFVSRLGTAELAAMTFTFPIVMLFFSLSIGLGAGTSSVLARVIGIDDDRVVRRIATDSMILALILVTVLSVLGLLFLEPIFRALGADDTTLPLVADYMRIWFAGAPLVIVPMIANSAIRATGNTKLPSFIMMGASAVNVVLDPILIFGLFGAPRLELAGAAYATLAARGVSLVLSLWVLWRVEDLLTLEIPTLDEMLDSWRRILHIGLPAALTNMIIPGAMTLITPLIASYGASAIAAFGAASRLEAVSLIFFYALSAIIGPFVGQNWGAQRYDRIRQSLRQVYVFCLVFGSIAWALLALSRSALARVFSDDPEVLEIAGQYLLILPISFGLYGIVMSANATFNALGKPLRATFLSCARMLGLFLPLAFLGSHLFGLVGIWVGAALANGLAGGLAILLTRPLVTDQALANLGKPTKELPVPPLEATVEP